MTATKSRRANQGIEVAQATRRKDQYVLRLYVAGASDRSRRAIERVRQLCETELGDSCKLEVIDVYQQPILARDGQIVATPTLVKELPRPVRRFIGDLTNLAGLFVGLGLDTRVKTR